MAGITIHKGTRQIGGCVTEIATKNSRVFIDFGENLPGNTAPSLPIDGLTVGSGENSALFFTHYHGDHIEEQIGRLMDVLPEVPVYMGNTTKAILINLAERCYPENLPSFERIRNFEPYESVAVGDISVMPFMIDHSAFDAYMFVIKADGKKILHTGGFRLQNIKGKLRLILRMQTKNTDYIICEGTTLPRNGEPSMSEHELRQKAAELMSNAKYVFVMCASTNIDRIGAFYHANPRGRLFVCDDYQKKQLETVRQYHADNDFYNFKDVYSYEPDLDDCNAPHCQDRNLKKIR